ncbi:MULTISPECIES: single-stranded DNA-binding protein [unclassified Schlesneria]|uniref:single-stranded DNA-binding protein n=1 Tax=Schlesneria TaxID=656899 RepID=UPI002EEF9AF9
MASFNKVILVGNLTRDPQVKYTTGGTAVTEIGLAVNRRWLDKQSNQWKDETTFVDVTLWGRTAEIAGEYLAKGRPVLIEGRLQLDTWDDRESGQKRSKLRVVGENMTMLGGKGDGQGGGGDSRSGGRPQSAGPSRSAFAEPSFDSGESSGGFSSSFDDHSGSQVDDVPF